MSDDAIEEFAANKKPEMAPDEKASTTATTDDNEQTKATTSTIGLASIRELFSFGATFRTRLYLLFGLIFAAVAGAVGPFMIFYFAKR
jgi:hypothetical protein